jgi:NADH-quinone oxidoreductase subunit G
MPRVIIDKRPIEVPEGTKVITAAEQLGIMIPRFCFHPALGAVGACRVCAVKFIEGPVKGIQMSCMIDAHDGMVVATDDPEAMDFRRHVIEWLMISHPHDCPVCDEGGHCLLQDMTVAGGHGRRRYPGPKRTHVDQYLGPLVQHEMNRCIQCYRCSRFYQEYAGYRDLGVMSIASRVYFGRYQAGILASPFSGNLADICPTGVYTDKPSRYMGRRWDYERTPGICIGCSLGCNTVVSARYRRVVRQEARFAERINGHFICDRGRHAYVYADSEDRPRQARLDQRPAAMDEALQTAAERVAAQTRRHGPDCVALWGSPRASLETMAAMLRLSTESDWPLPLFFDDALQAAAVRQAAVLGSRLLAEVEAADFILVLGADPLNEAPMLALAMRQAVRKGAAAVCLDPRPLVLPCPFEHHPMRIADLEKTVTQLERAMAAEAGEQGTGVADLAQRLRSARRPLIVYSAEWLSPAAIEQIGRLAQRLISGGADGGLFALLPGANALGAALIGDPDRAAETLLDDIERGRVTTLLLVENDPFSHFPDRGRLAAALKRVALIIALDYLSTPTVDQAHIFLPTTTIYESGGTWLNQAACAQWAAPAHRGGLPLAQTNAGRHPPRQYDLGVPGGDPAPAWQLLNALLPGASERLEREAVLNWLGAHTPFFRPLLELAQFPAEGLALGPAAAPAADATTRQVQAPGERFELLAAPLLFGGHELADRSPQLRPLEQAPVLAMSPSDAGRLDLSDDEPVAIDTGRGTIHIRVAVREGVAPGTVIVPRHRKAMWQQMSGRRQFIGAAAIRKV